MYHSLSGSLTDGLTAVEREINALPTFVWGPSIITSTSFSKIWLPSLVYSLYHCGRPLKCKLCQWKVSTFVKTKSLIPVTLGMSFHWLWVHTSRSQVKVKVIFERVQGHLVRLRAILSRVVRFRLGWLHFWSIKLILYFIYSRQCEYVFVWTTCTRASSLCQCELDVMTRLFS